MSEIIDTKNHPTVKLLSEHQERLELTNIAFARRFIRISAAAWSLLKSGTYDADPTAMIERCEAALQVLNDEKEMVGSTSLKQQIIELSHVRTAIKAVKNCYNEEQNRLIVFLADTGGGKTTLVRRLQQQYRGAFIRVEAAETWRHSYFSALVDVAEALGLTEAFTSPRLAQSAVIDKLATSQMILGVDEGHYCGPEALNLLKLVLNKTPTRVILTSIPQLWERLQAKAYKEAQQLRRRTHAKIVVAEVTADDCRAFIELKMPGYAGLKGEEKDVINACRKAANEPSGFGLYDTLQRICSEVECDAAAKRGASLDIVQAAIKRVEALRS